MAAWRHITVDGRRFGWTLRPHDEGLRLIVRTQDLPRGRSMTTWFAHGNLVTPWLVSQAITRALGEGWTPHEPGREQFYHYEGVLGDRPQPATPMPAPPTEAGLLEQIAASPDDEGAYLVYADWLEERGDPHGRRIALACAGALADDERTAHEAAWLGPVADVTARRVWKRGLLASCALDKRAPGVVDPAIGHRAWSTVVALDGRPSFLSASDVAKLVAQPVLRALRQLNIDAETVLLLPRDTGFDRLEALTIVGGLGPDSLTAALLGLRVPRLRKLAVLVAEVTELPHLLTSPIVAQLEVLSVSLGLESLTACIEALRQHAPPLTELCLGPWAYTMDSVRPTFSLTRGTDGDWSALRIVWAGPPWPQGRAQLLQQLRALPTDALTAFRAECTPPDETFVHELYASVQAQRRLVRQATSS